MIVNDRGVAQGVDDGYTLCAAELRILSADWTTRDCGTILCHTAGVRICTRWTDCSVSIQRESLNHRSDESGTVGKEVDRLCLRCS